MKNLLRFATALILAHALGAVPAYADNAGLIARGLMRTMAATVEIPRTMLANAGTAFPLGLVGGAVSGAMRTVAGTVMGVADIGRGAAPYAKYALFAL